ncbi:inositol polyphosphate phosphatase [Phellopilus nigrolimitatus]|nr:inositol polyphosphate phosphatase [Phellopilus nigrolimitatus]
MHLYLKDSPTDQRTLVLCTSSEDERAGSPSRALVFRSMEGNISKVMVEFLPKHELELSGAIRLTTRRVKGCLGLINIGDDTFLAVILSATDVGNMRSSSDPPESVARIHDVGFYSLNSSSWDDLSAGVDSDLHNNDYNPRDPYTPTNPQPNVFEHPCSPLMKIMSSNTFYYALSPQWDISSRLSRRIIKGKQMGGDSIPYDDRFLWNEYIVRSLLDFRDKLDPLERHEMDQCQFIVLAIQGYVGVFTVALPAPPTNGTPVIATVSLISRLGWKRAGTRFNTRGIDDDGNCANFVETETIFNTDENCFSYVQVRGSVPLFWEQQGLQTFGQRIQITRPHASQPAFEKHFAHLIEEYNAVHAINLLGTKENETILSSAYAQHLHAARSAVFGNDIGITHFDFHNVVRIGGHESVIRELKRQEGIQNNADRFGYTLFDPSLQEVVIEQSGIFRTNCLDCLDRTNFVQDIFSRTSLEQYLTLVRREWIASTSLWNNHRELWAENGDALSRIYAGTGALNTSFTRSGKRTLGGMLSDATKSVSRAYINNFQDKSKQTAIDMFLGNLTFQRPVTIYDPIHDTVNAALALRLPEYSSTKSSSIFVGTWNLNGRPPSESLLPWLFPRSSMLVNTPDMLVLGFQEIVPLTAQQIVQTDPEKRRVWENAITETLDRRPDKKADYILLRSEQLVGTALLVFVKTSLISSIRNVEATTRKTGLRGMSGNKGAVGIRLDFYDTSFCFLTAHLAAGHSNVEERNSDYRTIVSGLHFLKGKTIGGHDNVIWLADTNYRIDMENGVVRALAEADDLDALVAGDQLKKAIDSQMAFIGCDEGPLLFRPTYRYDLHSQRYDTSEKMRIPAWTDRILYRGDDLDLVVYSRAELLGSDHRPVFAIFRAEVRVIDATKRNALHRLLLDSVVSTGPDEKLDEKLASMTLEEEPDDLPPPSSEEHAWWIDLDHPDGVYATEEVLSKARDVPSNPFDSAPNSPLSSPSSSDEELYTDALSLVTPTVVPPRRKPVPPPPPSRSTKPVLTSHDGST